MKNQEKRQVKGEAIMPLLFLLLHKDFSTKLQNKSNTGENRRKIEIYTIFLDFFKKEKDLLLHCRIG